MDSRLILVLLVAFYSSVTVLGQHEHHEGTTPAQSQSQLPPHQQPHSPQDTPQDDCLMKCMNEVYQKTQTMDIEKILDIQKISVGNATAMCPRMNDTAKLDQFCGSYKALKTCTDKCPDTPIKKMSMSAFKTVQFLCIDRYDDVRKNMPCLSEKCPEVQRECIPKCGSVEATGTKVAELMQSVHGGPPPPGAPTPAPGHLDTHGKDVDMSQITKVVGDTCKTIDCIDKCSEATVTKQCGKDAYLLQRDFVWTMFTSAAQSMSSMGLQMQWPAECQPLANADNGTVAAGKGTTVAVETHMEHGTTPAGGNSPPAATPPAPHEGGEGKSPTPHGEVKPTPAPEGETKGTKNTTKLEVDSSKKCEKPPCGSGSMLISSTFMILISALALFFRNA